MRILGFWNEEREGTQEAGGRRCGDVLTVHRATALPQRGREMECCSGSPGVQGDTTKEKADRL